MIWRAIVLAGSRPGRDDFAEANGVAIKALIPVGGIAMVARPVAALLGASEVERVDVLAQQADLIAPVLPGDPRVRLAPSGATIAATLDAILADPATKYPLLITTADHALLDPAMIADFCARAGGADLAVGLVERRALEARLPDSKRTWIGFRGGAYSGANLFALGSADAARAIALWRGAEQDRKKGWRLVAQLGPLALLGAALRLRSLDQTLVSMGRRLGLNLRAVTMADPLAAVDVDKPADLAQVEAILQERAK